MNITGIRLLYEHISLSLSLFPILNKVNTVIHIYYLKQLVFSSRKNPNVAIVGTRSLVFSLTFFHLYPLLLLDCHYLQILNVRKTEQKREIFTLLQDS